jgi:hypothetical protein
METGTRIRVVAPVTIDRDCNMSQECQVEGRLVEALDAEMLNLEGTVHIDLLYVQKRTSDSAKPVLVGTFYYSECTRYSKKKHDLSWPARPRRLGSRQEDVFSEQLAASLSGDGHVAARALSESESLIWISGSHDYHGIMTRLHDDHRTSGAGRRRDRNHWPRQSLSDRSKPEPSIPKSWLIILKIL